ncbi:UNVERIFIED_CONTAM: hypothetical protein GTU68_014668 [Idotea baltica]|nr:hypothetical protein [Idotea baltica]
MAIDTNWDIEKYRTKFESDEHWELKREFMVAHKDRFSEERVICLAQVFVNIELMRCKYPDEVMKQVSVLAKEIGHDYKANQKQRLQRTFVKASDAANAKVKGLKRSYSEVSATKPEPSNAPPASSSTEITNKYFRALKLAEKIDTDKALPLNVTPRMRMAQEKAKTAPSYDVAQEKAKTAPSYDVNQSGPSFTLNSSPFSEIVLCFYGYARFPGSFEFLKTSLGQSNIVMIENYTKTSEQQISCSLQLKGGKYSGQCLGQGLGHIQKDARNKAAMNAVTLLLKSCFLIKIMKRASGNETVNLMSTEKQRNEDKEDQASAEDPTKLSDDNVGAKLLKLMGWGGGALGKSGQGITEPIINSPILGRQGLGASGLKNSPYLSREFKQDVNRRLQIFARDTSLSDMVFPPDLTSEERKFIHLTARRIGKGKIKSVSYSKGENRYLVVKHNFSVGQLLRKICLEGIVNDKYELCQPGTLTLEDLQNHNPE